MVQLGPYYSISEWWIHLAIFWNFSEGGCPKLEFLWALILQHVNQNKWLRFKTNHGSHFCSNWTKTKRKQKQSGDYIQGIYGRDCICTGNWFGDFRSGWAKLARQGCRRWKAVRTISRCSIFRIPSGLQLPSTPGTARPYRICFPVGFVICFC